MKLHIKSKKKENEKSQVKDIIIHVIISCSIKFQKHVSIATCL